MACPAITTKSFPSRAFLGLYAASAFVFVAGCNSSTCFIGVINPPNNSLTINTGNVPTACSMSQTQAAVTVAVQLAPVCTGCSSTPQVSRVHLLLIGIELHPGVVADDNSPDWQELAPNLAERPLRMELTQDPASNILALPDVVSGRIPAGTYYQLRLYLAESSSLEGGDGRIYPLQMQDGGSHVDVQLAAPFTVTGGRVNEIRIELRPEWGLIRTSTGSIELAPQIRGQVDASRNGPVAN